MTGTGTTPAQQDEVFGLLSNHRRRYALHYCRQVGHAVRFGDLAEQVAAWEQGKRVDELDADERKRVYISLKQNHIPAMQEADVVEYDGDVVELTPAAEEVAVYMDIVPGDTISWAQYYLGLSAVAAGLYAAVWVGTGWSPGPWTALAALLVGAFAASSVVHAVRSRRMRIGAAGRPPEVRHDG